MSNYRVYLTDKQNNKSMKVVDSKEEIINWLNEGYREECYEYRIIMNSEGTDIIIISGRFKDGYEEIVKEALEYEYEIIDGVKIRRYKPEKSQETKSQELKEGEENSQKGRTQGGEER